MFPREQAVRQEGSQAGRGSPKWGQGKKLGQERLFFSLAFFRRKWRPEKPLLQVFVSCPFDFLATGYRG